MRHRVGVTGSQRWLDHPWGPVFIVLSGLLLVLVASLHRRNYESAVGRDAESYLRKIYLIHRWLTRPAGYLFILAGLAVGCVRLLA